MWLNSAFTAEFRRSPNAEGDAALGLRCKKAVEDRDRCGRFAASPPAPGGQRRVLALDRNKASMRRKRRPTATAGSGRAVDEGVRLQAPGARRSPPAPVVPPCMPRAEAGVGTLPLNRAAGRAGSARSTTRSRYDCEVRSPPAPPGRVARAGSSTRRAPSVTVRPRSRPEIRVRHRSRGCAAAKIRVQLERDRRSGCDAAGRCHPCRRRVERVDLTGGGPRAGCS